jgi:hypothetical protein
MSFSNRIFAKFIVLPLIASLFGCVGGSGSGGSRSTTPSQAATPLFSVAAGTYTSAQSVAISDSTAGATIYYTTDGTTPASSSKVYSSPIPVSTTEMLEAIATASGYTTSAVASAAYTITPPSATPTFSVAPGAYTSAQTVTISDSTPGTTIYFTTDGTTPTTSSTVYSGPISVSTTETLQAIAAGSGYSQSAVATAAYTVALPSAYWKAPTAGSVNSLGTVMVPTSTQGFVSALSPTITGTFDNLICTSAMWDSTGSKLTIAYTETRTVIHVTIQVNPTSLGVAAAVAADQPIVASVDMGSWNSALSVKSIAVPYYTSTVWYAQGVSEYVNTWWDWHSTNASLLNGGSSGTAATYYPKTDGTRNTLNEELVVEISPNIDDVFPYPGNAPSPYMSILAGRIVLDIGDAGFSGIQQNLASLGDYGVSNCVAIIHDWQYAGYDNALPEHYPANPSLGGSTGIEAAIGQGAENGCLMAVHENYTDYYPNYPQFTSTAIALNSAGSWMDGWLNPVTGIQSFVTKPSLLVTNAMTQSPLIHQAYGTTAGYQDVLSAAPISWRQDFDANIAGAAKLVTAMMANQSLWNYERQTHNGPEYGEGLNHWYYSGLLDGVEAQLGAGSVSANIDASLPLFVDFDLLRIHPLQINHGMGLYERWTSTQTTSMSTSQLDAYRMQEIAYGHAPFLGAGTWNNMPIAFSESNLVSPVSANYANALASAVQYQVNGTWMSASVAAQSAEFSQVQVAYNNGTTVVANSSVNSQTWNGLTIPQYGWAAKGTNLLAYTALCGSTICDYAQTLTSYFANARNQSDIQSGSGYAAPSIVSIQQGPGNSFMIAYGWQVNQLLGTQSSYTAFVHFVNDSLVSPTNGGEVFGDDHSPMPPTTTWSIGQNISDGPWTVSIPSSVPDGTYSIRVGLYDPASGNRLLLAGNNDGTNRYIVGYLTVSGGGSMVRFTAPAAPASDPRLNSAGTVLNFGTIQTDGMVSITQSNGMWVLRPYPRFRNFTVMLNTSDFPEPSSVQAVGTTNTTVIPILNGLFWSLQLDGSKYYTWPVE